MRNALRASALGFLLLLTAPHYANAQKTTPTAFELQEIVIAAPTRQETLLRDAPCKVVVVSGKEIKRTGAQTVDDVFKHIPEVTLVGNSAYQSMKRQVTLRGVPDQTRTLILVDGIPQNTAWTGRVEWEMIPVDSIERVEIVSGPMSALYGSGAMGGVINIVTKTPKKHSKTSLITSYGTMNSLSKALSQEGKLDRFAYSITGRFFKTDGYVPEKDPEAYSVKRDRKDWVTSARFTWFPDERSKFIFGFLHNEEEACRGRRYFNIKDKANMVHLEYSRRSETMRSKATLFANDQDWRREFDKGPNYDFLDMVEDIDHAYLGGMFETNFYLPGGNILTAGIDCKKGTIHLADDYRQSTREARAKGKQHLVSVFAQGEIRHLNEDLIITLGIRGDYCESYDGECYDTGQPLPVPAFSNYYDDEDWSALSPKASLVYHARENTTLRVSYGRAFRAPDLKELYMVLARPQKTISGNPDLDPETLDSYEIGVNHRFPNNLALELSCYYSQGDDFISQRTTAPKKFQYDNITRVTMQGLEARLSHRLTDEWSWQGNYTFNESMTDKDESDPTLDGNDLPLQPRHRASTAVTYENPTLFTLSAVLGYVGEMYSDLENTDKLGDHATLDLRISRKIGGDAELSLSFENIFDVKYDVPNTPGEDLESPRRMLTGSLALEW